MDKELKGYISTLQSTAAELQESINAANEKIDGVETELKASLTALRTDMETRLNEKIAADIAAATAMLQQQIDAISARIDNLESRVAALESTVEELINRIQNLRKDSGFDVTDKIDVAIFADGNAAEEISRSLAGFKDYIAAQTLARSVELEPLSEGSDAADVEWDEALVRIKVSR